MTRVSKVVALTVGIVFSGILILFGALMIDWVKSSARAKEDALIAQNRAPDKHYVAEIRLRRTGMHAGPDKIYVTISEAGSNPNVIYERTYECDDLSAFHLHWDSLHDLRITYGKCDAWRQQAKAGNEDFNDKQQNRVWRSDIAWRDVRISYEDSKYAATH